ncbi:MAG TPA: universal stress protein, partial [Pseudomonadales bacterium]|nr:universal stress protein [Pseudomonadales bacterium]
DAKQFMLDFGFEVTAELIPGNIFNVLNTYKNHQGIELLVMGAYGHSAVREFFVGSNTTRMISTSNIPLLIIK